MIKHTLCWDCANACGGCSWSDHFDHTPVPGWTAEPAKIRMQKSYEDSYIVIECPEFKRDATGGGLYRLHDTQKVSPWKEAALNRKIDKNKDEI